MTSPVQVIFSDLKTESVEEGIFSQLSGLQLVINSIFILLQLAAFAFCMDYKSPLFYEISRIQLLNVSTLILFICGNERRGLKMKVGIITFHRAQNYGAVLQAYALQNELSQLHVDNEIIDYRSANIEELYRKLFIRSSVKNIIKHILLYPQLKKKDVKFLQFISEYLHLSRCSYTSTDKMGDLNNQYDVFITGSDQVWNTYYTKSDPAYFLDFVTDSTKKNSYAASFGISKLPKSVIEDYKTFLKSFNHISVREQQGQIIVHNLIKKDVTINVDPVFLLTKKEWEKIAVFPPEKDYILVYLMNGSKNIIDFINTLAKKTNLKIVYFENGLRKPFTAKYVIRVGPREFLGYIANAKYVVTNSFHGIAFSILFHKCFFTECPSGSDANSRIENLLQCTSLMDRLVIGGKCESISKEVDYEMIESIFVRERLGSVNYLKEILGFHHEQN